MNYRDTVGRKLVKRRLFDGDFQCENSPVKMFENRLNSESRREKYLDCKHSQSVMALDAILRQNEWRQQTEGGVIFPEDSRFGWWNGRPAEGSLLSDVDFLSPSPESPERIVFSTWKDYKKYQSEHRQFSATNFGSNFLYGRDDPQNIRRHRRKSPNILRIQPAHQFFSQQKEIRNIRFADRVVPDTQENITKVKEVPVVQVGIGEALDTRSEENTTLWNDLTLDVNNLDWLLNFRVQDIVKSLDDDEAIVGHDHNYESMGKVVTTAATPSEEACTVKPPYTYPELIEMALRHKGHLTVSGIYNWIMETFSFYKMSDERWKNAVRHNLSINPQFKKGRKQDGSSHLWKMATEQEMRMAEPTVSADRFHWKKRKLDELERNYPQLFNKQLPVPTIAYNYFETNEAVRMLGLVDAPSPHQTSLSANADRILYGEPEHRVQVEYLPAIDRSSLDAAPGVKKLAFVSHQWQCGLLEEAAFLNPISSHDVVEECGLLTDPTSAQRVLSIPRMQCANDLETGSDLFDYDLLRILSSSPL